MVVNSLSTGLSPSYGLRSGDNSQTASAAALAKDVPSGRKSFAAEVDAAQDPSIINREATDVGQAQSTLERARRPTEATPETLSGKTTESPGGRPSPGIALYERIRQYDNGGPSTSTLLKSWNDIMQGGQDAAGGAAALAKALSQNETSGFESGILDLTA
jgi:hypothetical protein